ncbi:MAG TPA: hypothetical protein VM764_02285 [Gemmatimonadaceae bacterium]|nr:hypothetical protein [Gemmatimonadaceae bacterium]
MRSLLPSLAALAALALAWPAASPAARLSAQRVRGVTADAVTEQRGTLRIGIGGEHTVFRDRWRNGALEPLGGGFSFSALGPEQLAVLGPLQQSVRDLGVSDFAASLGSTSLDLRQRIFVTPFSLEFGATDWLTLGVTAPLVRVRSEAQFRSDGSAATVGLNPFFIGSGVGASNRATIDRYVAASASLTAQRDACTANPASSPACPTVLAEAAQVDALIAGTAAFAGRLESTYGAAGGVTPSAYVPMAGSAAELALLARVDSLRNAFTRYGVSEISATTGLPLGAQAPLALADLNRLIADSTNGYGARQLRGSARINIGDIDVGVKVKLYDSFGGAGSGATVARMKASRFGLRQSVGLTFRIGSGIAAEPGDFLDLGTGTGENALGVRSYTDIVINERFWSTVSLGWAQAQGEDALIRVPSTEGDQLLESWREVVAPVKRGAVVQAEVSPRWLLNDYFAVGGYWGWRERGGDDYTVPSTATAAPPGAGIVPLDDTGMRSANASTEQRVGFEISFSTLAAQTAARIGGRFEISYSHQQSVSSGEGIVPKRWEDRLQLRYYTRLFGR